MPHVQHAYFVALPNHILVAEFLNIRVFERHNYGAGFGEHAAHIVLLCLPVDGKLGDLVVETGNEAQSFLVVDALLSAAVDNEIALAWSDGSVAAGNDFLAVLVVEALETAYGILVDCLSGGGETACK